MFPNNSKSGYSSPRLTARRRLVQNQGAVASPENYTAQRWSENYFLGGHGPAAGGGCFHLDVGTQGFTFTNPGYYDIQMRQDYAFHPCHIPGERLFFQSEASNVWGTPKPPAENLNFNIRDNPPPPPPPPAAQQVLAVRPMIQTRAVTFSDHVTPPDNSHRFGGDGASSMRNPLSVPIFPPSPGKKQSMLPRRGRLIGSSTSSTMGTMGSPSTQMQRLDGLSATPGSVFSSVSSNNTNEWSFEENENEDEVVVPLPPKGITRVSAAANQSNATRATDTPGGAVQLSSDGQVSIHSNSDNREPPISTIIIGEPEPVTVHCATAAASVDGSKLKRKCVQCCWPMSLSSFFTGLGRFFTGFNLTVKLPHYCTNQSGSNGTTTEGGTGPSIPFENLEEETQSPPPLPPPQERNCVTVDGNSGGEPSRPQSACNPSPEIRVEFQLPFFIVLITISQWVFFHFIMNDKYEGWFSTNLEFNPLKRYEIWRFFTATWIHGTATHLRGNLELQLIAGVCLEVVHGWKRVGILYFGGVIFANLTTSVMEPFLLAYGASGGVYALLTGHLASNIMNWKETWGASNRCLLICIYLAFSILAAFSNRIVGQRILPPHHLVGHAAHVGGALAGLLIGFFVLRNFRKNLWEIKAAKICRNTVIVLVILAVGANIGDQISLEKGLHVHKQNKLLQSNHTNNSVVHYTNITTTASVFNPPFHSKTTSNINSL